MHAGLRGLFVILEFAEEPALIHVKNHTREVQLEQGRETREGFATLATGMAQITALLTNLGGSEMLR